VSLTSFAFLLAFSVGALLALVRGPIFGLLTYVGVFFLSPADRWWGEGWMKDFRWSLAAAAVTIVAITLHRDKINRAPFWSRGPILLMTVFVLWLAIQLIWVRDTTLQVELLIMYAKLLIVMFMVVRCIDSASSMKWFLWAHVLGTFYFGWLVFRNYGGGRFEGFGGPGLDDANSGALALATGVLTAAALFLVGNLRQRLVLFAVIPVVLNGLVATISRSGFLALAVGGVAFNVFTPKRRRGLVMGLSALGLVAVLLVTNPQFWLRMSSMKYAGAEVASVDTGGGRLEIMQAQLRMFRDNPFGCGHRCTALLSPSYLDDKYLTGSGADRARSSHNTFMSLLVEQGVIGGVFYLVLLVWTFKALVSLRTRPAALPESGSSFVTAIAAVLAAIVVGDLFVDFLKFEIRFWYVAALMLLSSMRLRSAPSNNVLYAPPDAGVIRTTG